MTADEFERRYAMRSRLTVEELRALGRIVAPCDCGEDLCEGWQSTTAERLAEAKLHAAWKDSRLAIYAWVGEDEHGSGKIGLKQGIVPAGMVPLVAMSYHLDRLVKLKPQMEAQAAAYGKKIRLCKFVMTEVAAETEAGEWPKNPTTNTTGDQEA